MAALGRGLGWVGLTPNRLSLLGLLLSLLAAGLFYHRWLVTGVVVMALSGLADGLDGIVARATDTVTRRGGYLDAVTDRYSDSLLFGALLLGGWLEPLGGGAWQLPLLGRLPGETWALTALVGALLTSYTRAAAERLGVSQEGVGLVERPERMVILALGLLAGVAAGVAVTWTLFLLTLLGHLTVLQRAAHFWGRAGEAPEQEPG